MWNKTTYMPVYLFLCYFSELLQIESLSLKGKAIEGDMLTAVEITPDNELQRNVWSKYKREITYQWYVQVMHMIAIPPHKSHASLFFCVISQINLVRLGLVQA